MGACLSERARGIIRKLRLGLKELAQWPAAKTSLAKVTNDVTMIRQLQGGVRKAHGRTWTEVKGDNDVETKR